MPSVHEATGQLSVVSGQRFAASSCGPRSRVCHSVLGAHRRPQRRGVDLLGSRRQASPWQASLVSAERFAFVPLHESQLTQWHTTRLPVTSHCAAEPLVQAEPQRRATRPGMQVRRTFSASRAWRPTVVARLTRTLGITKARPVASSAGSAARSAESQAATARHSREQPASLVHFYGIGQKRTRQ